MASFSSEQVAAFCRLALEQFLNHWGENSLPLDPEASLLEITAIVIENLSAGRLDRQNRFRASSEQLTLPAYLHRLIPIWSTERARWRSLRAKDRDAWASLKQDLNASAQRLLRNRHLAGSAASTVDDYVQRACLNIITRCSYRFDVPLLLWTRAILKNTIRESDRSHDALDLWHYSLDSMIPTGSDQEFFDVPESTDPTADLVFERIGEREAVLCALNKLTTLRRAILILTYFHELADADITQQLGITHSHLYSTRHRALKQMSKELQPPRELQG